MTNVEGCPHSPETMAEWNRNGACPLCLTAILGMRTDRVNELTTQLNKIRALAADCDLKEIVSMVDEVIEGAK